MFKIISILLLLFTLKATFPLAKAQFNLTDNYHYELLPLESINLNRLKRHQRFQVVLYEDEKYFYKIWEPDYFGIRNFLCGLHKKFFLDIDPLVGIIYDKNHICRGYICTKGKLINQDIYFEKQHNKNFDMLLLRLGSVDFLK